MIIPNICAICNKKIKHNRIYEHSDRSCFNEKDHVLSYYYFRDECYRIVLTNRYSYLQCSWSYKTLLILIKLYQNISLLCNLW